MSSNESLAEIIIIPDFDFDDPTKPPVGPDGAEWPWVEGKKPGTGGFKNPNGPESLSPDVNHPDPIGPHWDYNDRKSDGYRIFPDGTIAPK